MRAIFLGFLSSVLAIFIALSAALAYGEGLFIVSPSPGEVIIGEQVRLQVHLPAPWTLVNPEQPLVPAENSGHLHIWMDTLPSPDAPAAYIVSDKLEYTLTSVFPGLHTLYVEFSKNDHTAYEPRRIASVEFETASEKILPQDTDEPAEELTGLASGIFLPSGRPRTIASLTVIGVVLSVLWYWWKRAAKR